MQVELWPLDGLTRGPDREIQEPPLLDPPASGPLMEEAAGGPTPGTADGLSSPGGHSTLTTIHLSGAQLAEAKRVGTARQRRALEHGYRDTHGLAQRAPKGLELHILGAAGELVVRDLLGLTVELSMHSWKGQGDLPGGLDVRTSGRPDGWLIFRDDDDPSRPLIHVCGPLPRLTVRGWLYGHECIRPAWRDDPGGRGAPAFFVPTTEELRPLATLPMPAADVIERWIQAESDAERRWRTRTKRG